MTSPTGSDTFIQRNFDVNNQETYFPFADAIVTEGSHFRVTFNVFKSANFGQYAEIYVWVAGS
jgi:hypothetical protein